MRVLFEIMFPLKPTLHLFILKDLNSLKIESMYIFKLFKCIFTLHDKVDLHGLIIKTYAVNKDNEL